MGFLTRRRAAKFIEELKATGEMADRLVDGPLRDPVGQQLRVAAQRRLEEEWQMPPFWAQLGLDYTNAQDDVEDEEDGWAFTDALGLGYVLREIEAQRPDGRPVPEDVRVRLGAASDDDRAEVAIRTVVDVAVSRLGEFRLLSDEAWDEFEYWVLQWAGSRSRYRRRERLDAAGVDYIAPLPSHVDYRAALAFGYALRSCQESSAFDELDAVRLVDGPLVHGSLVDDAPDADAPDLDGPEEFDPDDHDDVDVRASAQALLIATEGIFVDIRAPSRVGVAINHLALAGQGTEEGDPQFAPASGAVLFGYALRMACADSAPLPEDEVDDVELYCHLLPEGGFDSEEMGGDPDALGELLEYAAELADDETRMLKALRVPFGVWDEFCGLAVGQLGRNLRRNGLKRRYVPSHESIVNLLRLGVAIRVIDEVAGESPMTVADMERL